MDPYIYMVFIVLKTTVIHLWDYTNIHGDYDLNVEAALKVHFFLEKWSLSSRWQKGIVLSLYAEVCAKFTLNHSLFRIL